MNPAATTAEPDALGAAGRRRQRRSGAPIDVLATATRLRARWRWQAVFSGFVTSALAGGAVVSAAAIVAQMGRALDGRWRWVAGVALMSAACAAAWAIWRRRGRVDLATWCARRTAPDHRERVRTAVELAQATPARLGDGRPAGGYRGSEQLAQLAMQQGIAGLREVSASVRADRRRALAAALALALLCLALTWGVPTEHWHRLQRPPPPPQPPPRSVGTLVVDLQLRGTPPTYARAAAPEVTGTDGDADVLRGSLVTVQARPVAGVRAMQLELEQGPALEDEAQVQQPDQTRRKRTALALVGGLLRWRQVVERRLRYRYRAIADDGATVVERSWREITVHGDAAPTATLRAPRGEVEVRGGDEVVLEGSAIDDLGLTHVGVAIALPSGQVRRRDVAITTGDLRVEVREALAVDGLKLAPGELATVWLEAKDNNGLDGQRAGSSARVTLRMFSAARHHERLLAAIAAVALRWTLRLADRLEGSPARSKDALGPLVDRRASFVASEGLDLKALRRLRERLADDVLARGRTGADLDEIARRLSDRIAEEGRVIGKVRLAATGLGAVVERGRIVRAHERVVDSQERAVVQLAALAAAEHRAAMVRDSKALAELEEELATVLEALKRRPTDAALRARAERLLDAIEARMKRIAASAARQLKMTPPEHINSGASNARGMQASLQAHTTTLADVRAKLRGGDFSGALDALKAGRAKLAKPLASLHEAAANERSAEDAALERLVAELLRGIAAARRGEEGLLRDVEPSATAQRVAAAELLRRKLQASLPQVERLLDDARDQIRPKRLKSYQVRNSRPLARGRAALSTAQEAVGRGGIDRALQALLEAREQLDAATKTSGDGSEVTKRPRDLRRVRTALDRSARAAALLRELLPAPEALHDAPTQRMLRRKASQQERLRRRLDRVRRALERRGHAHPALQRQVGARLAHASGMMRQVTGSLKESDAARAHEQIAEVRSALAQARRLLNQRNSGQGGGQGGRPVGQQRGQGRASGAGGGRSGGTDGGLGRGASGRMRLESGNRGDSGEDFRREVLKAMKRRAPSGYDARLRRYYRGLTETR